MNILEDIVTKNKDFIEKCADNCDVILQECDQYFKEIDLYLETENADFFKAICTEKENLEPVVTTIKKRGRRRKPALVDIVENIQLNTEAVAIKKEKISDVQDKYKESSLNIQVKKEVEEMPAPTKLPPRKKKIKVETVDLPKRSARTRSKKAETEEIASDSESTRSTKNSDIIIQNSTITTIEISDNEKDTDSEIETLTKKREETRCTRSKIRKGNKREEPVKESSHKETNDEGKSSTTRSTRTKTIRKKRDRSNSVEHSSVEMEKKKTRSHSNEPKKKSRSDTNTEQECNGTLQTEYEDALSVLENNQGKPQSADATYVTASKNSQIDKENPIPAALNSTMVVENPKMVTKEMQRPESDKTDFEDIPKTPPKSAAMKANKQIFSPFEKTPVKKKVEAFERLGAESSAIPTRVTRTKKKALKGDGENKEESEAKSVESIKNSPEKDKVHTPMISKFIPKMCSTSKISKLHPMHNNNTSTNNETVLSMKSSSALKASQAEFRLREKQRQEKEREALRKREALLHAQTEEKRRKREEKQQRAQQQREILEKEAQKQLEAQKIKEEKYKQAIAEREKKLQKQKEENEKKRLLAKKKANELLKEKEEVNRVVEQKKYAEMKVALDKQGDMVKLALKQKMERAQQQTIPIYMTTKPPLLPTADCYDSDDDEYDPSKVIEPAWGKDRELREMQIAMITVGETIKNSFFCRQAQTPDLQEIFETIDPRKLKRTSSAIWRKPPRYTLMPTLETTIEFSEDSD